MLGHISAFGARTARILLVRHARSTSNARGRATWQDDDVPLTPTGIRDAQSLADKITSSPGLIVTSSSLRARQTAAPLCAKFPLVPVETWAVHEFAYLDPRLCLGTTADQRRPLRIAFWARMDPGWRDGADTECFRDFAKRVKDAIDRAHRRDGDPVYMFTHSLVIRLAQTMQMSPQLEGKVLMAEFRRLCNRSRIENCQIVEID
jgi:broad specificity phosphatase PhoE